MVKLYYMYLGILYLTIITLLKSSAFNAVKVYVPGYNIYIFLEKIGLYPTLVLILYIIGIFIPEVKSLLLTFLYVFIPYIMSFKCGKGFVYATLMLIFPPIMLFFATRESIYLDSEIH